MKILLLFFLILITAISSNIDDKPETFNTITEDKNNLLNEIKKEPDQNLTLKNKTIKNDRELVVLKDSLESKTIKDRKLLPDSLQNFGEHHAQIKNLFGGLASYYTGDYIRKKTGPTNLQRADMSLMKFKVNNYKNSIKMMLMDRGKVIQEIHSLIEGCEENLNEIKTSGINAIYGISSAIDSSNKKQQVNIKKYKKIIQKSIK